VHCVLKKSIIEIEGFRMISRATLSPPS
jgi:hypothetical protein